jgi:hypothetical protein
MAGRTRSGPRPSESAGLTELFSSSVSERKPVTTVRADYEFAIAFRVPHHPHLLYLLHLAGWRGDVVAATSFTAAALIGAALALEAQAIASPAARLRRKSVLRMNISPRVSPFANDDASLWFHVLQ